MKICISRQESPIPTSHKTLKTTQLNPHLNIHQSHKSTDLLNQSLKIENHHHQPISIKSSFNDSILIQDKQNCYISNHPHPASKDYESELQCCNHPKEKADYSIKMQSGQKLTYCTKCASFLMKQGFKVQMVVSKQKSSSKCMNQLSSKSQQLNCIWLKFERVYEDVMFKKNQTDLSIVSEQSFYNQQIQEVNTYFQTLHQHLQILKNQFYNSILHQKQEAIKKSRQWTDILSQLIIQIQAIETDIQLNQQTVLNLDNQSYRELTSALAQHLKQYQNISISWKLDPSSMSQFVVPAVEEALQSISNIFSEPQPQATPFSKISRMTMFSKKSLIQSGQGMGNRMMGKSNSCVFTKKKNLFCRRQSQLMIE